MSDQPADSQELVVECPECDSLLARLADVESMPDELENIDDVVESLAPAGQEKETIETWAGGVGGAVIGGTVGALFGPPGVAIGVTLGGAGGSMAAMNGALEIECENCGGSQVIDEGYFDAS